jgi:hypothetical protein
MLNNSKTLLMLLSFQSTVCFTYELPWILLTGGGINWNLSNSISTEGTLLTTIPKRAMPSKVEPHITRQQILWLMNIKVKKTWPLMRSPLKLHTGIGPWVSFSQLIETKHPLLDNGTPEVFPTPVHMGGGIGVSGGISYLFSRVAFNFSATYYIPFSKPPLIQLPIVHASFTYSI